MNRIVSGVKGEYVRIRGIRGIRGWSGNHLMVSAIKNVRVGLHLWIDNGRSRSGEIN